MEAKEAGAHYGIAAGMLAGGVFGIAAACASPHAWIWVLGGAAVLHFGGAVALVLLARQRLKADAFFHTLAELKKDQTWLMKLTNKP